MKELLELKTYEFEGADGEIHEIRQCPYSQRNVLLQRLNQIGDLLGAYGEAKFYELFDYHPFFNHLCCDCLRLAGISLDWVGVRQIYELLQPRRDGDQWLPGALVMLNFPAGKGERSVAKKPQTYPELIATVSTFTQSLQEALSLAETVPSDYMTAILSARAEISHQQRLEWDKDYARKNYVQRAQSKAKQRLQELRSRRSGGLNNG